MNILKHKFNGAEWLNLVRDFVTMTFDSDKDYELIIRDYKEKRSLQANNYSWVLTNKLAEKMLVAGVKISKEEMHAEMIFRYGQPEVDENGELIFWFIKDTIKATDYYPYAKPIGNGRLDGEPATKWQIFRGSHDYNKSEFSIFIKGIVEECHEQGIETKTPDEIARMISLMKEADDG